jgi:hypothetical protein
LHVIAALPDRRPSRSVGAIPALADDRNIAGIIFNESAADSILWLLLFVGVTADALVKPATLSPAQIRAICAEALAARAATAIASNTARMVDLLITSISEERDFFRGRASRTRGAWRPQSRL